MINQKINCLFEDLTNQALAINLLKAALIKNRIAPAYLFCGPKGLGQKKFAIRFLEGLITNSLKQELTRSRL